jgi:hypothetical protein
MRLKTLNGAPLCEDLDFGAETLLSDGALAQYLYSELHQAPDEKSTAPDLKWRRLASTVTRLRTGWSQPYLPTGAFHGSNPDASFSVPEIEGQSDLPPDDTTILDQTVTLLDYATGVDDFVQHALTFHDTLLSSQIAVNDTANRSISSSPFMETSFQTMSTDMESQPSEASQGPILQLPSSLTLTSLASLPSAHHLRSIYPQTPTPNFLCVLTAPPNDRDVFVRKGGYKMSLREITVADETKSGFRISFWNRPSGRVESQNSLAHTLERVRAGDILLLRNIALNAFRDNVYGQSLNPSIARVRTSVEILMSSSGISNRQLAALPAPVAAVFMRVKRWASAHVAPENAGSRKRKGVGIGSSSKSTKRTLGSSNSHSETLPPDTMEAA